MRQADDHEKRKMTTTNAAGVLPSQTIKGSIGVGLISSPTPIRSEQIQPASLDLRLGRRAHWLQASFLPGQRGLVDEKIGALTMAEVDLSERAVLHRGCVYLIELDEQVDLPAGVCARANPKSTTGRLDVFTRLVTDHSGVFDYVAPGYRKRLYAEVMPRTFSVIVRAGLCLSQLRLIADEREAAVGDTELKALDEAEQLVFADGRAEPAAIDRGVWLSVDLDTNGSRGPVAYRGRDNAPVVDMLGRHDPRAYWESIDEVPGGRLILNPGDFYILASRERVRVPADYAAEMVPIDPSVGELRIHYAGFFDPGFGYGDGSLEGTRAVLEVRAHETPFALEHGQVLGRLEYSRMAATPERIYGAAIGSSYQRQGLTLSRQFRR